MGHLWDALEQRLPRAGVRRAAGGDEVFRQLVLARIIEPTSKLDSLRVLAEAGVARGVLPDAQAPPAGLCAGGVAAAAVRGVRGARGAGPGQPGALRRLHPVFRDRRRGRVPRAGFSKERRLEPQITIGLLTDAAGFPLMVSAFEGNKAETKTMLPVIEAFMAAHQLPDVTVVADAGMVSEANQKEIEAAGLSFILGMRIPRRPLRGRPVAARAPRRGHPRRADLHPALAGRADGDRRDQVIYYQYRADRARRTLRGIDEQVAKAEKAVAGKAPVKRNRFIQLSGGTKTVNRDLEAKARALAGLKGYITNLAACPDGTPVTAEFVIGAYHQLFEIEKSFRMSKHDLQARPIYHHKRDSIEAHLTIVFAALAVSRWIEAPDRLVNPEVRPHRPPLPHHRDPGRRAHHHRRRPPARRPPPGPRNDHPRQLTCALAWPDSGPVAASPGAPPTLTDSEQPRSTTSTWASPVELCPGRSAARVQAMSGDG